MAPVTRTFGPLHVEDLEPLRFEDLVRALVYDFRPWRSLEATRGTGADADFDVRGWELIAGTEQDEENRAAEPEARLWLIQCKRERRIGPPQIVRYLDEISEDERPKLYGLILAAACDFSKKAQDAFRAKCFEIGVSEFWLWGRGELEDLLIQPKNDHLLFAFFGVSTCFDAVRLGAISGRRPLGRRTERSRPS